jgi:hypothetical protein
VSCNKGGAYIVCELDGTLYHNPVAAYHVIPYFACDYIELPNFEKYSNISVKWLREMESSTAADPEDPEVLYESGASDKAHIKLWNMASLAASDGLDDSDAEEELDNFNPDA